MGQVLDVDRHHRESVLGMVAQVVHDAGLAGSSRCREHHMPGAQRSPQLGHECRAEPQVNRVDGSAGVEFGGAFRFHVYFVVKQICCGNYYTTILMYVNCVVDWRSSTGHSARRPREAVPPSRFTTASIHACGTWSSPCFGTFPTSSAHAGGEKFQRTQLDRSRIRRRLGGASGGGPSVRRLTAPDRPRSVPTLQSMMDQGHISIAVPFDPMVRTRTGCRIDAHGGLNGCGRGRRSRRWSPRTGAARS